MWEKSNLKQFNIRQQNNKTWKKGRGINTFARHCMYICIYIIHTYTYNLWVFIIIMGAAKMYLFLINCIIMN